MSNHDNELPRVEIARKARKLKPVPAWVGVYESYVPADEDWPQIALPILLLGQGIIWVEKGHPNVSVLCQIMSQIDPGVEVDVEELDTAWDMLVQSLRGLGWDDKDFRLLVFTACASILADGLRRVDVTNFVSGQSEVTANDVLKDVYGQVGEPADPSEGDPEPMFMDTDEITEEDLEELRQELSTGQEEG